MGLKQLTCNFMGGEPDAQHGLEAFAEVSALQLKAQKPPKAKRNRRQRHQQSAEAQALYILDVSSSTMQVGSAPPAVMIVAIEHDGSSVLVVPPSLYAQDTFP